MVNYLQHVRYALAMFQGAGPIDPSLLPIINALLSYGPVGLIFIIIGLLGKYFLDWYRTRQKRLDDLNDTVIGSLRAKETEHSNQLKDLGETLSRGLEDMLTQAERSESVSRDISKQLAELLANLATIESEQRRQWSFILFLARVVPAKDERRRALNENEIRAIVKAIREEYPS